MLIYLFFVNKEIEKKNKYFDDCFKNLKCISYKSSNKYMY